MIGFNALGQLGRLGNQMFQFASLKGIARHRGFNFCFPPSANKNEWTDHQLLIPFKLRSTNELNIQYIDFDRPTIHEQGFTFNKDLFDNCPDWITLQGFFQTEKYFKHIEKQIRKDFTFKDEIKDECDDLIKQFTNPIALHIRRGDFVWNNKNHPPLSLDYYESALKLFDSDREVIIFSDDTEWCKNQDIFADDRFAVAEGGDQFYDMCLMSMCDDFIIANSTFSWWGAWLGNRGKVVAPKQWFGEALSHDTKDLYCKGWTVL